MSQRKYLHGQKFGRLLVVEEVGENKHGEYLWKCICDCKNEHTVSYNHLVSGHTTSCGCKYREFLASGNRRTHGMTGTPTYTIWNAMLARCYNPKTIRFEAWGGRGIKVCDQWRDFEGFYADMGEQPPGMSLDRIDGDRDYELGNCKWSTPTQQAWNRKTTRWIMLCGNQVTLKEACVRVGISDRMVHKLVTKRQISHTEAFYDRLYEKIGDQHLDPPIATPPREATGET